MNIRYIIGFIFVLALFFTSACDRKKVEARESDSIRIDKEPNKEYDETGCLYTSYNGLVMAGYQGWFTAVGDGANRGWHHYESNGSFEPGKSTIDFWPDVSEYDLTYETAFSFENGEKAHVYSPFDSSSVDLHFKWMKEYGIDGVFMQRFVSEIRGSKGKAHFNKVLENALNAARKYERAICVMYDLSGSSSNDMDLVLEDWKELQGLYHLFDNKVNPTYLRHNKQPMVAVWGVGFNDGRKYDISDAQYLVASLKNDSNSVSVMLGVPYYWREQIKDTDKSPDLHPLIQSVDVLMPWAVGRYNNRSYGITSDIIEEDISWCNQKGVDYVPLVFPGFSWGNLQNKTSKYDEIKRKEGDFIWGQISNAKLAGAEMLYVAMFDEVDEGTAIFKCLKNNEVPLNAEGKFVGIENHLDNDYYLWLTGQAANWFHGDEKYNATKPLR